MIAVVCKDLLTAYIPFMKKPSFENKGRQNKKMRTVVVRIYGVPGESLISLNIVAIKGLNGLNMFKKYPGHLTGFLLQICIIRIIHGWNLKMHLLKSIPNHIDYDKNYRAN